MRRFIVRFVVLVTPVLATPALAFMVEMGYKWR